MTETDLLYDEVLVKSNKKWARLRLEVSLLNYIDTIDEDRMEEAEKKKLCATWLELIDVLYEAAVWNQTENYHE